VNTDSERAVEDLVERALTYHERKGEDMEDAITDLRHTEETIRSTEAAAWQELRSLREEVETADERDVGAYAQALADRQGPPKARASKVRDSIRRIETLVLPGCDEALWLLRGRVITTLRPEADDDLLRRLGAECRRWARPQRAPDPSRVLVSQRARDPKDEVRPPDIVDWVTAGIERIDALDTRLAEEEVKQERYIRARDAVNKAQAEYNRGQQELVARQEEGNPGLAARNQRRLSSGIPLWDDFNREAFLKREGLLSDYGFVDNAGGALIIKGGREPEVPIVPAEDAMPVGTAA
jgi:hypothetical protein